MSDISSVSSLSNLSRDLYYQYMIDHNSMKYDVSCSFPEMTVIALGHRDL